MKRRKGFYSISVVAKMFSVHQQTIRMYEKEGLITPKRSDGNTRLFSEEDVDRLEEVIYLTHKLGVNLAGVEMILKLQKKIRRMQDEMNNIFKATEGEFELESLQIQEDLRKQAERLATIKKENITKKQGHFIEVPATEQQAKKSKKISSINEKVRKSNSPTGMLVSTEKNHIEQEDSLVDDIEIEYDK